MVLENCATKKNLYTILCVVGLLFFTFIVFYYTLEIREPWQVEELSGGGKQWLTGSTLEFSKEWYHEGPINIHFGMFEYPASVEFPTLKSRSPYTSYPPGAIIPIYVLSKIRGKEPTISMIMKYNLVNHFLIAFFLSLLVFFFLSRQLEVDLINSALFATIPILFELLMPGTLYWHQNVFFSDQAVILPFVLFIFLEVLRFASSKRVIFILSIIQALVMFYGVLTDWLFIPIVSTIYLKRIINNEIKIKGDIRRFLLKTFYFWVPVLLVGVLFLLQIYSLENFDRTIHAFSVRASLSSSSEYTGTLTLNRFLETFSDHLTESFGYFAHIMLVIILLLMLIFSCYLVIKYFKVHKTNDKLKDTLMLAWMLLLPCIIQIFLFKNHSFVHEFSVLKFSVPLSIIPFVIIPVLIYLLFEDPGVPKKFLLIGKNKLNLKLLIICLVALLLTGTTIASSDQLSMFPSPNKNYTVLGGIIHKHTNYYDVVFSPDFEIKSLPPQQISLSMKPVYKIQTISDIKEKTKDINGNYNIMIVFSGPPSSYWTPFLENATSKRVKKYYFYRISPNVLKNYN